METLIENAARPFAVVTGASSGIGLELARELAERGFDLLVTAEDAEITLAADALSAGGGAVRSTRADLTTTAGVDELVAAVKAVERPVDVLCLNAGAAAGGAFLERPLEDNLKTIALDVLANVRLTHALLPAMVARGTGRVLATSSVAALQPGPYYATYAASKSFVQSFFEALRREVKDSGVTITTLLPGPTDTDFFAEGELEDSTAGRGGKDDPAKVAREGIEAALAGKDKVEVKSLRTKMQSAIAAVLPDRAKAAVHETFVKPDHAG
ncbi:SDR family NAD(P)-dependent oxidoreductase [Cellulomonas marina]|uniref:Short-chain dehydrogenase n=1 Tax=Cellulomonas marina TaxID=988821 RepID=A0A1I0YBH7_9CELL|nr:SDR family NAD(P)-dependent oxidoreductase [Cellulomonas marina]GIG29641.1 oxidoreductase [Cellulomonas marina]SFB10674.1 Short-chain dehydrogenase [Cellulomonas marina]